MHDIGFVFPNDAHPTWSIMIVLYPYITGLVAGAFVVSAQYHVFRQTMLKPVARLALLTALCFCAFATTPLLLHLHQPFRAFNIVITPSHTSAMAGFGFIYSLYMLLLLVEVWLEFRPDIVQRAQTETGKLGWLYRVLALGDREISESSRAIDRKLIHWLAMAGIPAACVLHGYVGFLFGAVKANPWWSTALMPVIFLVSAIVSGVAALIVLYLFLSWRRQVTPDAACVRSLARSLWLFLVIAVSLELLEIVHMAYEGGSEWPVIKSLLTEKLLVSYGIVQLLMGSVVPLILLVIAIQPRLSQRMMFTLSGVSGVLVLIQVFAMRWNVVVGGQMFSKSFRGFVDYHVPFGGREGWIAAVVVLSLPLFALWLAGKLLPIWSDEQTTTPVETSFEPAVSESPPEVATWS